jgi:hypothetical protein
VLTKAAACEDSLEQMAYVAAFTISSYAKTVSRTGKPFNPLLGETYEFDDTGNTGWRALSEQVTIKDRYRVMCMYCVCPGRASSSSNSTVC